MALVPFIMEEVYLPIYSDNIDFLTVHFTQMNEILGEDYEKKMAVVNVLKQYAEDRDVDMMARALAVILRTSQQMKIISQIRQFVPPRQRPRFDELYRHQYSILHPLDEGTQLRGEQSTVKVHRVDGNFGFVIKGNNPVSMETVDPGGPADKAGLQPGDVILRLNGIDVRRCSHSHLVQLLQDSGPSPVLDILRPFTDTRSTSSVSMSSTSSQASSQWMKASGQVITDKEGKSFRQRVEYLLTSKERSQMRKAMLQYDSSRNIAEFFNKVSNILDTPSKQLLWKFIVVKLPESHQEFCLNRINLSRESLLGKSQNPSMSSFQQQVDYLLTSKERTQLKRALQIYSQNRKVDNLIEDMEVILDTPSKGTLWMYIVPLLITEHQGYAREKLQLGKSSFSSDDESQNYTQRSGVKRSRGRLWKKMHPGYGMKYSHDDMELSWKRGQGKSYDMALMKELEETRKVVEEAKKLFQSGNRNNEEPDSEDESHLSTKYVTVIPIGQRVMMDHAPEFIPGLDRRRSSLLNGHSQSKSLPNGLNAPPEIIFTSESDSEVDVTEGRSPLSIKSGDSFNTRALTALKELDAAMAAEVSDIENGNAQISPLIGKSQVVTQASQFDPVKENKAGPTDIPPIAPVAPPPPPPVPPPAPDITPPPLAKMNVKRINWEKLDQRRVGNTIWEQLGDEDLDDVVKYLELEQHFCTQVNRAKISDKKTEVYILDPKKAYNLSILLGHLRLSVDQMKEALYLMDEEVLTPDVLKQLLAFAPSSIEMDKFESFNGDAEDFSKPDKFVFEMSRIPGYEQRLKAMLFKENFNEKVNEMKENLQNIRKASKELRNSKKLAKLLELILAMGNYMNKGNQRVGEAAGFKITFLNQLDITKTKDNKSTFLNVLADAVYNKFPSVLTVGEELPTVMIAGKVSDVMLNQELQDLRKVLQVIITYSIIPPLANF
ncbi:hypothetical protein FSP39_013290 [Pinctada imbricata]|uniref:Delphilin n=1 Tax=Pinctada imbricata TaxID=66713 RepID=A0AA88XRZ6_PINIB|nr:hypothetical protein FSP39_013290 [Pinctada imbricata]